MIRKIPNVVLRTRIRQPEQKSENPFEWKEVSTHDLFKDTSSIIFSIPGAFTPTCSSNHLPRYEDLFDRIMQSGVDNIYCISVNDAFVMRQWGLSLNINKVQLLPDGNGEFTRKMGKPI